ncbi:MAG: glycosyltransferase family 2 protein [Thaumarchaeota archaeon]|nr:glycosyltransferase family 2 protein [Nitrososphaerota archaeon]
MILAAIPAFNEEKSIAKVLVQTMKRVDKVLVCDDGSSDETGEIARSMGAQVISHERNLGKGEALRDLFREAQGLNPDVVVTLDADGQHNPSDIPRLVAAIEAGADVVVGSRFSADIPLKRRLGNKVLSGVSMTGITDTQSGFRSYRGKVIGTLMPAEMGMGVDTEILKLAVDNKMKIVEVPIGVSYEGDTSTYNPVFHGLDVLLASVKQTSIRHPLLFYGLPGFVSLLVAAGLWWWTLSYFREHAILETNVTIVAAAATLVGTLLMAVAIILWVLISVVRESR